MKLNRLLTYDNDIGSIETVMNHESVEKLFSNIDVDNNQYTIYGTSIDPYGILNCGLLRISCPGTSCDTYPDLATDLSSNSELSKGTKIFPFIFTSNGFTSHDEHYRGVTCTGIFDEFWSGYKYESLLIQGIIQYLSLIHI